MRPGKWLLSHITMTLALASLFFQSCHTENGIDNNNVIRTPYSAYFSDKYGALYNTNDGKSYKIVFPSDGYIARGIVTDSPSNIIWVKKNVHLSLDNGLNFNPTYLYANPNPQWQAMILSVPSQGKIYVCSTNGKSVAYSVDGGRNWIDDINWDGSIANPQVESFAQTKDGRLFAYDNVNAALYMRVGDVPANWSNVSIATPLPPGGKFFITSFNNTLVATDVTGANGALYSTDGGQNWVLYTNLPSRKLYATAAPFNQTLMVGTDSFGVYKLQAGVFVSSNNGLAKNTSVYGIVGKQDTYKNNIVKQYIYLATSTGLYRSEDGGLNWIMLKDGDMRSVY